MKGTDRRDLATATSEEDFDIGESSYRQISGDKNNGCDKMREDQGLGRQNLHTHHDYKIVMIRHNHDKKGTSSINKTGSVDLERMYVFPRRINIFIKRSYSTTEDEAYRTVLWTYQGILDVAIYPFLSSIPAVDRSYLLI